MPKTGGSWPDFVCSFHPDFNAKWYYQTYEVLANGETKEKPQRFTLTVAHLNHDPMDCSPENLKALCSGCHLRYDAAHHAVNAANTRSKKTGQLSLL